MADTVTDPLEKAVLSGAIFAGPDPEGEEPHRPASDDDFDSDNDGARTATAGGGNDASSSSYPSGPVQTTKGQSHNTGVKGVLADYRNRNNLTNGSSSTDTSRTRKAFKGLSVNSRNGGNTAEVSDDLSDASSAELSDAEQEARDAYRRKRMEEMRLMGSSERRTDPSRQRFGHLREVGQSQFIKAVEDRSAQCVVIHVYDHVRLFPAPIRPQTSFVDLSL